MEAFRDHSFKAHSVNKKDGSWVQLPYVRQFDDAELAWLAKEVVSEQGRRECVRLIAEQRGISNA